jgi:hypothetical protein
MNALRAICSAAAVSRRVSDGRRGTLRRGSERETSLDLYSSLRVLQKRWRVAVPLLVLTLIGVAVAVSQSSASKKASGEVVLLAAPTPPNPTNENPNPPIANNPYALMELPDIVDVISRSVSSDATSGVLARKGLSGTYTIGGNKDFQRGPIMTIEATSSTEESALRSYHLVVDEAQSTLDRLQDQAGANPAFRVKMQRLTAPTVSTASTLVELRAALIALLIGLLITLTAVFGAESISRGHARRRAADVGEGDAAVGVVADLGSADERTDDGSGPPRRLPTREPAPSPPAAVAVDGGTAREGEVRVEEPRAERDGGERAAPDEDLEAAEAAARRRERAARRRASAARRRQAEAARARSAQPARSASSTNANGGDEHKNATGARKPRPRKPKATEDRVVAGENGQDGHREERAAPREGS